MDPTQSSNPKHKYHKSNRGPPSITEQSHKQSAPLFVTLATQTTGDSSTATVEELEQSEGAREVSEVVALESSEGEEDEGTQRVPTPPEVAADDRTSDSAHEITPPLEPLEPTQEVLHNSS